MAGSLADHSLNLDLVDAEGVDLLQAAATVHLEELFKGGQLSGRGEEIKELLHTVKESANLTSSSAPVQVLQEWPFAAILEYCSVVAHAPRQQEEGGPLTLVGQRKEF